MTDTFTDSDFVVSGGTLLAVTVTYETETGEITGTDFKPVCKITDNE